MKATVFVVDGEPLALPTSQRSPLGATAVLDIAPDYSLRLTMWALQSIMANSRCHASRQTARSVLEVIAKTGEVATDSRGLPASVKFPGKIEERMSVWVN